MQQSILILDFGSQYTQLIARRLRELNIYTEIHPYNKIPQRIENLKGIILSGSPCSVNDEGSPYPDLSAYLGKIPVLGICYGAQMLTKKMGGVVGASHTREYGRAHLQITHDNALLANIPNGTQVWMSHSDTVKEIPANLTLLATTDSIPVAAFKIEGQDTYGIQFHPEVSHSIDGMLILKNFAYNICHCTGDWTPEHFVDTTVAGLKEQLGNDRVVLGLSGGVDSSVAAVLLQKAAGDNLYCIFINNGLLRKNEFDSVLDSYKDMGLNVKGVDASELFMDALKGISEPEAKRKAIGRVFIDVFDAESHKIENVKWLAQGTIYPDVIESVSMGGPSVTIKATTMWEDFLIK